MEQFNANEKEMSIMRDTKEGQEFTLLLEKLHRLPMYRIEEVPGIITQANKIINVINKKYNSNFPALEFEVKERYRK